MRLIGFLLLISGWAIVVAALLMLHNRAVYVFVVLGVAVEILGLSLVAKTHLATNEKQG
ncbi:MAG TPA: hypothetical protein VJO35_11555 [Terriglobales bacterium]|nr:hypothetical protein [Terriglobales bacterium]